MTRIRDKDDPQALSTEPEPEQEYIITEELVQKLEKHGGYNPGSLRSRPLAKAPEQCPEYVGECQATDCISQDDIKNCERFDCDAYCKKSARHDAQIAHAATLAENKRVLGAAWELFPEPAGGFRGGYLVGRKEIIRRLNTLRIQEPPK
jgi:hypothetical protein